MHIVEKTFKEFADETIKNRVCYIAYSGGVDSQVLLHLSKKYIKNELIALHVNHGISKNAIDWTEFCKETAINLSVKIKTAYFELGNQESNLEEVARQCRHGFFADNVKKDTILLTGHHLDDQAETFMLRLMRGSGVDGLSSMSQVRDYGDGQLMRPLLDVSKEDIRDYALKNNIKWVEDESNESSDYDRNFLRNEVLPLLKTRWAGAAKSISRSAKHCEDTKVELKKREENALKNVLSEDNNIKIEELKKENPYNQSRMIRLWLEKNGFKMPSKNNLDVIIKEVAFSRPDSQACFKTNEYTIRKSFGELFILTTETKGKVFIQPESTKKVAPIASMKMKYKGRERTFKYVMKEEKIPYWERDMYAAFISIEDEKVVAFGDILSN